MVGAQAEGDRMGIATFGVELISISATEVVACSFFSLSCFLSQEWQNVMLSVQMRSFNMKPGLLTSLSSEKLYLHAEVLVLIM